MTRTRTVEEIENDLSRLESEQNDIRELLARFPKELYPGQTAKQRSFLSAQGITE